LIFAMAGRAFMEERVSGGVGFRDGIIVPAL
jgi:hypothetical protein